MKGTLKKVLKKLKLFEFVKKNYMKLDYRKKLTKKYVFECRKKDNKKVCFILAGYKEFLYDNVFARVKKFITDDIDVCILSSGKYSQKLSDIAKKNNWSYLSTERNNVSLIQNVAINLFKEAEYIYKLDEDIFVTDNYFKTLYDTLIECETNGSYKVGFVAPTIPINGFGNMIILDRFGLVELYTKNFEKPLYAAGRDRMVESNPEVAKFFWSDKGYLPNIDKMNAIMQKDNFSYVACPIRFSIGAILFKRDFWEKMKMFKVDSGSGMGSDEQQLCECCISNSNAIIVSKNSVVGHLSFGKQNETMKKYFEDNKEIFNINNEE